MKVGRPSTYSNKLAREICAEIATTPHGLRKICSRKDRPKPATVYRWLLQYPEFREQYARARYDQAQVLFEQMLEIADRPKRGQVVTTDSEGKVERRVEDMTQHRRLQIDTRKWILSKLLPKKYGEFERVETSGPDGGPIQVSMKAEEMTEAQIDARLAELHAKRNASR